MTANLVTGGAAFVGSRLSDRLIADGADVLCVDNFSQGLNPTLVICAARSVTGPINIGNPDEFTILQLAELV